EKGHFGLDPATFGKHPNGSAIDAAALCVQAPSVLEVRLPAELAAGVMFVTTATLHRDTGAEGSVQVQVLTTRPTSTALRPDALTLVNAYEQIVEFATQDRPDMVIALKPLRKPIHDRAEAFKQALVDAEPKQVEALIDFAARAYRRPLAATEANELRGLYHKL